MKNEIVGCLLKVTIFIILSLALLKPELASSGNNNVSDILKLGRNAATDQSAADKLINILKSDQISQRRAQAAIEIGNARIIKANQALLSSLENDDDIVRREIALALGKLSVPSNFPVVLKIWKNRNESEAMRAKALEGLSYFNSNEAVQILIEQMKSTDGAFYFIALKAIKNCPSPQASLMLLTLLKRDDTNSNLASIIAYMKQKESYAVIINIVNKKLINNNFDSVFDIFLNLLINEKYAPAMSLFVKSYLLLPSGNKEIKNKLIKLFRVMNLNTSYVIVAQATMNMRAQPNTRAAIIGTLDVGQLATVIKVTSIKYTIEDISDFWYEVKSEQGKIGWLFGGYLKKLNHRALPNIE